MMLFAAWNGKITFQQTNGRRRQKAAVVRDDVERWLVVCENDGWCNGDLEELYT
jgi:hypothetical protein